MTAAIQQGDALDERAFKAAMAAYYEACPGLVNVKRPVEAAIKAYLAALPKQKALEL